MLSVALTGGIATGKSYVLARLKRPRYSYHRRRRRRARGARRRRHRRRITIAAQFGDVISEARWKHRSGAACEAVFAHPESRRQLEAIVHPVVYETIRSWFDTLDRPLGVASIPLLYETRREKDFDVVVVTVCPPE